VRAGVAAGRDPSAEAMARWREGAVYRALAERFADCPLDDAEPVAVRAEMLLADHHWVAALLDPLVDALAANPFFEPKLRTGHDTARSVVTLFECPALLLTASVIRATAHARQPAPETLVVPGRIAITRYVRAGGAVLRRWRAQDGRCVPQSPRPLTDGLVHRFDGRHEAQQLAGLQGDVVQIVATVCVGSVTLARAYSAADGRLLRAATVDDASSRAEMLLTFLRVAGRADAGERFAAATHDRAHHLRWAAMREWLALDARAALPRLEAMAANDASAEVRAAAARTLEPVRRKLCPG
jgi:hypothetical protein